MKITSAINLALIACVLAGCTMTEKRKVKINPSPVPGVATESKLPLSAVLVLDKELKNYGIKHELISGVFWASANASYQVGGHLARYAEDVSRTLFKQVTVVESLDAAPNKADVILIPKAARSDTHIGNPIYVMLCVEWLVKDRAGQQTLWLTSVESQTSEKPVAFAYKKHQNAAYQRVFDDLALKTVKAFQESPEIKRLTAQTK